MRILLRTYKIAFIRLLSFAVIFIMAVMTPACSSDTPAFPEEEQEKITVSFMLSARRISSADRKDTRAPGSYPEVGSTGAEDYINIEEGDIQFYLFDESGGFIQDFTPDVVVTRADATGNIIYYSCIARLSSDYFRKAEADKKEYVGFRILATANDNSMNQGFIVMRPGESIGSVFSSFIASPMSVVPDATQLIETGKTQHIPMAGIQTFSVRTDRLRAADESEILDISDNTDSDVAQGAPIDLLRAMSKVQVIDKIDFKDGATGYNPADATKRISAITFTGIMPAGTLVPQADMWASANGYVTSQISAATLPVSPVFQETGTVSLTLDRYVNAVAGNPQGIQTGINVWSCYLWEWDQNKCGGEPYMTVTLAGNASKQYRVRFVPGTGDTSDYTQILRNHIYTFVITGLREDGSLSALWTVCPMDKATANIPSFN